MKKILFLAPQPFFQERGTPIAIKLALKALGETQRYSFDLLVYSEGQELSIPKVRIFRSYLPGFMRPIGPGISWRKIVADIFFSWKALQLVLAAKREGATYDLVHAVEEGVFVAFVLKTFLGVPYVYDMDSCLSLQLTDKWRFLRIFKPLFVALEQMAIRPAVSVVAVCEDLAVTARQYQARSVKILHDVSLIEENQTIQISIRKESSIPDNAKVMLYVGNLEGYQGIDLLLESFQQIYRQIESLYLVIIGGRDDHIAKYREIAEELGIGDRTKFIGPRAVSDLGGYLKDADLLVSPRISGNNTPMKIYSYLHAGKAIVATELPTHTQVLNSEIAILAKANPDSFAEAIKYALLDPNLAYDLGENARKYALEHFTYESFARTITDEYARINNILLNS